MNEAEATGVAVVSGGARGIGRAIAAALVARGHYVAVVDNWMSLDGSTLDAPGSERADGFPDAGQGEVLRCDVRDEAACREALSDLVGRRGGIAILANVAGILRPGPFLEDTPDTWDLVMSTHVGGHLNLIRAVLPSMTDLGRGCIVNFTSTAGLLGSRRQPAYSTAKEALVGLTRCLARMLAPAAITVNAVSPTAETRMSAGLQELELPEGASAGFAERSPDRVGEFVAWLTAEQNSDLTGRVFLAAGRYVAEFEDLRPWKWARVGSDESLAQLLRWVIGRPHPAEIGPWPTRDFTLVSRERRFEGTTTGPQLVDDDLAVSGCSGSVISVGNATVRSAAEIASALDAVPCQEALPGIASGAIVHLPPAPEVVLPLVTNSNTGLAGTGSSGAVSALCQSLQRVQQALRLTRHHERRGIAVILPSDVPSSTSGSGEWLHWYGAIGLIRGAAATEAIYGVRTNGVVVELGGESTASELVRYLLSEDATWLNGYVFVASRDGVALIRDEQPAWQLYTGGGSLDQLRSAGFLP